MARIDLENSTTIDDARLFTMCQAEAAGWRGGVLSVRVRYSRGADFSGTCVYDDGRILINIGKHEQVY